MIAIIIAGGSGTRLWPLSTPDYPKHLLALTNRKSLLQNTYDRASQLTDDIYIVPEKSHVNFMLEQLPQVKKQSVIVEPARRGTASCLIAALSYIKKAGHKPEETVVFMHADHHIRDTAGFLASVKHAARCASAHQKIVLLGVEPTHPITGFGYIQKAKNISENGQKDVFTVAGFKEKPDRATAEKYVMTGKYLWNMGFFIAPLKVFEKSIKRHAPNLYKNYLKLLSSDSIDKHYLSFSSEAIDTALIEQLPDALVVSGQFDWMDVGSYPDLHKINIHDSKGNTVKGSNIELEGVNDSYVQNETDVPLAIIGLDSVIVVNTHRGVLVTSKTHAQKIGDVSKRFNNQ